MSSPQLPNYLRTHRKRACLSQEEVAFLLGSTSDARISRHERSAQTPNLRTLLGYELLFRTPIRELYGGVASEVDESLRGRARRLLGKLARLRPCALSARKIETLLAFLRSAPPGNEER